MRGDLLSGGVPKKLHCQNGNWTLEVVRQVAVERNVYRPHVQRLEGSDAILSYLKRSAHFQSLADTAGSLLVQKGESRSYDVVNGEWVQSELAPSYIDQLKRQHRAAAQSSQRVRLLEVRAECVRLRHANTQLLTRVEQLEQRVAALASALEGLAAGQPQAVAVTAPAAQRREDQQLVEPTTGETPSAAAELDLPRLCLPKASDLTRCIEQLMGSGTTAQESSQPLDVTTGEKLFVSLLLSDDDQVVGAIIMDVVSTVFLGGTLLMVPEADLASQVSSTNPSEDSIAASSEVCNALSGSINNVAENVPVRTKYLEELKPSELPWLGSARVLTLQDSFGGRILIACR